MDPTTAPRAPTLLLYKCMLEEIGQACCKMMAAHLPVHEDL